MLFSPEETDIDRLRLLCDAAHLEIATISTDGAALRDGLSLTSPEEEVRQAAVDRLLSLHGTRNFIEVPHCRRSPARYGSHR